MIGEQPPVNIDDLLADETVTADTAIKKGMAETDTQEKMRIFVESILDRGTVFLTSEKGNDYYYTRDGSKLLRQKKKDGPWEDATEEAFKRQKKGWEMIIEPPKSGTAFAEGPAQQAGEPTPASARVGSAQTEKLVKPEASAELVAVLDEIRKDWMILIEKVQTPEEYVQFREKTVITINGKPTDIRFFPLDEIKDSLRRVLTHDEVAEASSLKEELGQAAQKKLYELVRADLLAQFNREQTAINAIMDEKALNIFVEELIQKKSRVTLTLSDALLTRIPARERGIDRKITDTEYRACMSTLKGVVQEKREELRKPLREIEDKVYEALKGKEVDAKDLFESSEKTDVQIERHQKFLGYLQALGRETKAAFAKRNIEELRILLGKANGAVFKLEELRREVETERELTNEELFAILVEALKSKRRSFGKDKEGKDLVVEKEDISDTEIKYRYGADEVVTTPVDVKFLLDMLREGYGWEPRDLSKRRVAIERKEAERIKTELETVISEKKALFQAESEKVSASPEVLSQNIAYLDSIVVRAQKAFVAGDIEYLRSVLKTVDEAVFKQEEPKKKKVVGSKSVIPVAKNKVVNKKNTLRGVAMKPVSVDNIFYENPFEGLNDSEEERGQTEEEKKYESLYQMLGNDPFEISLEKDRMRSAIATGLQTIKEKMKGVKMIEIVRDNREALITSFSQSIITRLDQFPFDQTEKEFFARKFIETYFDEDHIK